MSGKSNLKIYKIVYRVHINVSNIILTVRHPQKKGSPGPGYKPDKLLFFPYLVFSDYVVVYLLLLLLFVVKRSREEAFVR